MQPIKIKNISLILPHKICFDGFDAQILYGSKIALIGDNGSGKTTLLKAISGLDTLLEGDIILPPDDIKIGYVPQIISGFSDLSGGQRFNKALTVALAQKPDILLLDEPTNHLDIFNRKSLMHMLSRFEGTLVVISHDRELLRNHTDIIWHIDNGHIEVFTGNYHNYMAKRQLLKDGLEKQLGLLDKNKKSMHKKLMQEQQRATVSRKYGESQKEKNRWSPIVAGAKKRQAQNTTAKKTSDISQIRSDIHKQISDIRIPEVIIPSFNLTAQNISYMPLYISNASVGYGDKIVLENINLSIVAGGRVAIMGGNASGKTTLLRGIMGDGVTTSGLWEKPKQGNIGYLDQHYSSLDPRKTVLEYMSSLYPMTHIEIRKYLNDFLFRKNEEVNAKISNLSGGEKARLSLAAIACRMPQLLILDEVTNNVDIQTKEHIENVLKQYSGAMLVVSHEQDFIDNLGIIDVYITDKHTLKKC